jgi:hypothetical protein
MDQRLAKVRALKSYVLARRQWWLLVAPWTEATEPAHYKLPAQQSPPWQYS